MANNNLPDISVIMPVYNSELYLKEAIDSILNQTFQNFEFIIVDDGSEDNSKKIIKSYKDDRIRFFEREHLGIVNQLNFGIKKARGKYIARMDSDDLSLSNRLEKQFEYLQKFPNVKLVGTDIKIINEDSKEIYIRNYPKTAAEIEYQMPIYSAFCHPAIMIEKKTIISFNGYDEKLESAEDHILFLQMLENSIEMRNLSMTLLKYRIHMKSVTSKFNNVQNDLSYSYGKKYLEKKLNNATTDKEKLSLLVRLGLLEYYRGEMPIARKHFLNAISIKPIKIFTLHRYLFLSLFGTRMVKYLREKKILSKFNYLIVKLFKYDTHKIKS
ncbi:MAG: glycosyltransferase [Melioribacteraceae bacterium]|nr:glycosyltransferase [Melioribacteraceae bacterium]